MNSVQLIGRIANDIQVRYTNENMAFCRLNIAINRGKDKYGNDKGADFPSVVVFGKQAENCGKYLAKGRMVAIEGRIQTGKYDRNGEIQYTTDVIASRVEFIDYSEKRASSRTEQPTGGYGHQSYNEQPQQGRFEQQFGNNGQQQFNGQPQVNEQQSFVQQGFQPVDPDDIPF